ncbi:UNVERIFIED_CONTAM: hypothetical protein GTU68_023057 [Idotea baltica]|nr:hypothetical protein [Idotea baltica]
MRAVLLKEFGAPDRMYHGDAPTPVLGRNEVLVKVHATALNRADTLQRKGKYPPPPGASSIMGLEFAGDVASLGSDVSSLKVGDRICGLLSGGGYAEYVTIHEDMSIAMPGEMLYEEAAAIPEVFLTAFQALSYLAELKEDETVLIHAGASGVGTAAIQLARELGAQDIYVTASAAKHDICKKLGAGLAIDYKSQNFKEVILNQTQNKGVDVIVDFMGASYFQKNINSLAQDGRMVMLAFMGGIQAEVNLANILRKRLKIMGSTLRARTLDYKIQLTQDFTKFAMPLFESGAIRPVIDSVYNWNDVVEAHKHMEANKNKGKIVLKVAD